MTVSVALLQPRVEVVIEEADPTLASLVDADTVLGVTPGAGGLALLATATTDDVATLLETVDYTPRDDRFGVTGSADLTKVLRFQVDGLSAATTRTWTWPNRSDTVAGLASQTFTGAQTVDQGSGTLDGAPLGFDLRLARDSSGGLNLTSYGGVQRVAFQSYGGTRAAKTAMASGTTLAQVVTYGWDGSALVQSGALRFRAGAAMGATEAGGDWRFSAIAVGDTTRTLVESVQINAAGIVVAAPGGNVQVTNQTTSGTDVNLLRLATTSGGVFAIQVDDLSASNPTWKLNVNTSEVLSFQVALSEKMQVATNGVGLGGYDPVSGNGLVQFAAGTTKANGLAFSTDVFFYRNAANAVTLDATAGLTTTGARYHKTRTWGIGGAVSLSSTDEVFETTGITATALTLPPATVGRRVRVYNGNFSANLTISPNGSDDINNSGPAVVLAPGGAADFDCCITGSWRRFLSA